jgi:hypothetical protein
MGDSKPHAIFHYIYVKEKENDKNEDKELKSLQTNLKQLTRVGIEEGNSLINPCRRELLDNVRHKMFPRQNLTKVL